ncbi:hypothetical protein MTO96_009540 [Rhipicephalus appendiculatus]
MALRILAGVCIFGAGWYALDQWKPGLLPRIDFTSKIAALRSSPATDTLVIEDEHGMDSSDTEVQASGKSGTVNAIDGAVNDKDYQDTRNTETANDPTFVLQGLDSLDREERFRDPEATSSAKDDSAFEHKREKRKSLLTKKVTDSLVPDNLPFLLRQVIKYVRRLEKWLSDFGYDNLCLLLSSILCFAIARFFSGSGTPMNQNETETSPPASPPQAAAVGWKSYFSISEMAGASRAVYRHEGSYIYSRGEAANQLRREDAAATTIQRWARTVFKPWLRKHVLSHSNIETPPSNSQHWIDEDHGAVASTILDDISVNVYAMGRTEGEPVPQERPLGEENDGDDEAGSHRDIRCQKRLSLSSANISKSLLRLKPLADRSTQK